MTSKQIKAQKKGGQVFWLKELCFQFATFNEHAAERDEYNAKADAVDAEAKVKRQKELSALLTKSGATLDRLGSQAATPYPEFVPPARFPGN